MLTIFSQIRTYMPGHSLSLPKGTVELQRKDRPGRRCGYLSNLFEEFYEQGLPLVTKTRKNMASIRIDFDDKVRLKKGTVGRCRLIESVNDVLMSVLDIDHRRHRSPANALVHTMAGLVAYHFYDGKPSVFIKPIKS